MKALIIALIAAFPFCAYAQGYLVNWDIKKCEAIVTLENDPVGKETVPSNKAVKIDIIHDGEKLEKITCKSKLGGDVVITADKMEHLAGTGKTIVELQVTGRKATFKNDDKELAYPYHIIISYSNNKHCDLVLGEGGQGGATTVIPKVDVNLFKGIQYDNPINDMDKITGEKHNALIVIDCSAKNKSTVLRFVDKKGKQKKVNHVNYGDMVGIYLINFNHYRYELNLDARQVDVSYDPNALFNLGQKDTTQNNDKVAAGTGGSAIDQTSVIVRLMKYAVAVEQLEEFIESVKNNLNPNSDILELNKKQILFNLDTSSVGTGTDINLLYESLDEATKKQYKETFDKAKKMQEKRGEIRLLTYTVKANIAPIRIKSYDKLAFDLTIKNKQTKTVIEKREYEYLIVGGWQINQSFGVCGHTLFDEEYAFSPVPARDTTFATQNGIRVKSTIPGPDGSQVDSVSSVQDVTKQKIIEAQSPSRGALSATTLTHLYYRGGRWGFGPALGIGVDFFPKATNIRYLVGGSVMLMDGRFRISLDAGCAFGKVSVLAPNQKVGDVLGPSATTVPMAEKSKRSLYLGISWNIPLAPKEKQGLE